jgi:hypothetical protein
MGRRWRLHLDRRGAVSPCRPSRSREWRSGPYRLDDVDDRLADDGGVGRVVGEGLKGRCGVLAGEIGGLATSSISASDGWGIGAIAFLVTVAALLQTRSGTIRSIPELLERLAFT